MARSDSRGATAAASRPLDIERELEQLEQMTVNQLRDKYAEVVGETTASRHRQWLIRRIAWRMRANVYGGLSERARELANDADLRTTPPRMRSVAPGAEERTSTRKVAFRRETRLPSIGSTIVRE